MEPFVPFLEVNQGAISIATLLLALVAFLIELHRANTRNQRELREEVQDALSLIEELEDAISKSEDYELDPEELDAMSTSLRALAATQVRRPILALALMRIARITNEVRRLGPDDLAYELEEIIERIGEAKAQVAKAHELARAKFLHRRRQAKIVGKTLNRLIRQQRAKRTF